MGDSDVRDVVPLSVRKILVLLAAVALIAGVLIGVDSRRSARAATTSNFVATGHDMDLHCSGGSSEECAYMKILVNKVRHGSSLPILALDHGSQVASALAIQGEGPVVTVDPDDATALNATALVDGSGAPLYSAIITASDESCGGCDNTVTSLTNINARSADIATFFNAGGGILALAGADNYSTYYNFVPLAGLVGVAVSPPFTVEPAGLSLGVTTEMANCCMTHNSFQIPAPPMVVLETDSEGQAETIAAFDVVIGDGGFVTPTTPGATGTSVPVGPATTAAPPPAAKVVATPKFTG